MSKRVFLVKDTPNPISANEYIEAQLDIQLAAIEEEFQANAISLFGSIFYGVDDIIRDAIENGHAKDVNAKKLVVLLTTEGGIVEVVQRIVETFRHFYEIVDFVIPNYAFSAGTVLVMSGDAIHMDYYSRLGPTDPQIQKGGSLVPALGYVKRFEKLVKEARAGGISQAEVQLIVSGFDQAVLYQFEQAEALSITLLKEWLPKYKFRNWTETETSKRPVTHEMRASRAEEIAQELCNSDKWHTHGRGISRDVLERDLKLKIDDFGNNTELNKKIRNYHNLLCDYKSKMGNTCVVHTVDHCRMIG
jgi:hypothetical protein